MSDLVNHPPHYKNHPSGVEVIELTRLLPFGPGNAVKYVLRRDLKGDPVQDIDKAIFYVQDSITYNVHVRFSTRLIQVGRRVIDAEPDAYTARFLEAITTLRLGLPDYATALWALNRLREAYVGGSE